MTTLRTDISPTPPPRLHRFFLFPLFLLSALFCAGAAQASSSTQPYIASHGVNFAVGNKVHAETDVSISGPTGPLSFKRIYNSRSAEESVLGYGWSWSFGEHLLIDPGDDSAVSRVLSSGRHIPHDKDGEGIWISPVGGKTTITLETGGDYTLARQNGTVHTYDAQGKLTQIQELNGYSRVFTYSGDQPQSVSDSFGRSFSFAYNVTTGYLETLTTPVGDFTYTYLDSNLVRTDRPDGSFREYRYEDANDPHNLTSVINEEGVQVMSVVYDSSDRMQNSYRANGTEEIVIAYNGLERTVTDALGSGTTYELAVQHGVARIASFTGPVCSVCPGAGDTGGTTYTDRHLPETLIDGRGNVTQYGYDDAGSRTTVTGAAGERTVTTDYYAGTDRVQTVTRDSAASPGQQSVTAWTYDANGNPDTKTEEGYGGGVPISRTTDYDYDALGRLRAVDGPRTDIFDIVLYDYYPDDPAYGNDRGMLHTVIDSLGHIVEYQDYNELRGAEKIIDANGVETLLDHNSRGQLISRTVGTRTVSYEYDSAGVLRFVFPPVAPPTVYDYWPSGRLKTVTDGDGNYLKFTRDNAGGLSRREIYDPDSVLTAALNYAADVSGREWKTWNDIDSSEILPSEELLYDAAGNLESRKELKDALMQTVLTTGYGYDELNRLTGITDPGSALPNTVIGYDKHDNRVSVTDSGGVMTSSEHDDFGRRTNRYSPDSGFTFYSYLPNDLISTRTDADGTVLTYEHDVLNRLMRILKNDSSPLVVYGYDETVDGVAQKGRLTSMTDASGGSMYLYSIHGELIKETRTTGGRTFITEYGYTDNGETEYIVYPSGRKISWNRADSGRLDSVESLYHGRTGYLAENITTKPFGPLSGMKAGSGLTLSRSFDTLYRISGIDAGGLYEREYSYWSDGVVKDVTDPAGPDHAYLYDDLGHLDTAAMPSGSFAFDHDGVGNRLSRTVDGTEVTGYDYAVGTNRLAQSTGAVAASYGYDDSGNITSDSTDTTVYALTDDQRLASVTKGGVPAAEYQYDGRGLRTVKTVNGETTLFVYCKSGKLLAEADDLGNITKEYVYLEGRIFAHFQYAVPAQAAASAETVEPTSAVVSSIDKTDELVAAVNPAEASVPSLAAEESIPSDTAFLQAVYMLLLLNKDKAAAGAYYYITDHLGAPRIITDDAGSVVWRAEYLPFGNVNISVAEIENNLRFPGQYFDAETGLHYNWNRYYNPDTGRYIAADPIGLAGGINLYAYVGSDPVNWVDPEGLVAPFLAAAGAGTVSAALGVGAANNGQLQPVSTPDFLGWWQKQCLKGRIVLLLYNSVFELVYMNESNKDCDGDCEVEVPTMPPDGLVENPNRPGSWGGYDENGKFNERWRYDKGRPGVQKGHGAEDHIHIDGKKKWYPVRG